MNTSWYVKLYSPAERYLENFPAIFCVDPTRFLKVREGGETPFFHPHTHVHTHTHLPLTVRDCTYATDYSDYCKQSQNISYP